MTWTLFRAALHQRRSSLLWFSVGLISYSAFVGWYYPMLANSGIQAYLDSFPKELIELFAGSMVDMSTFGGYAATEYLGFMWVLIIASAVILFATKCLSGEVASGTMELVLAQPVPRRTLVVVRFGAMLVYVAVLVAATVLPLRAGAVWQDVTVDVGNLAVFSAAGFLLAAAIGAVTMAIAAVSSDSGKPAGIVGGALGAMWLLLFLSGNVTWAEKLNPINVFHYWAPATMVNEGTASAGMWWFYGGLAAVGAIAAVVLFSRRDVA
jgi:ABC-2 type transport system permease protein